MELPVVRGLSPRPGNKLLSSVRNRLGGLCGLLSVDPQEGEAFADLVSPTMVGGWGTWAGTGARGSPCRSQVGAGTPAAVWWRVPLLWPKITSVHRPIEFSVSLQSQEARLRIFAESEKGRST